MKLIQTLLIAGVSAFSISAFAAQPTDTKQSTVDTAQPTIVTTQAVEPTVQNDTTQDVSAAAVQPESELPVAQDAAIQDNGQNSDKKTQR